MYLGLDVSKNTLDAALLEEGKAKPQHKVFANTAAGHEQLLAWLGSKSAEPIHAALEATGTWAEAVALALHEAGHRVSLVNPARIHAFARTQMARTKTDKADSLLIARFAQLHQPELWVPPAAAVRELQALVRRLEALEEMRLMEENRLGSGGLTAAVQASLREHITYLREQIDKVKRQIKDHIDGNPGLKQQRDLLLSIPGVGETTAALLLAELGEVDRFDGARAVAAFAGLVPRIRQSGTSVRSRPRLSKVGSPRLRKALYFPAITALRFNPLVRALGQRLQEKGKPKMLIIGAAMRKMIHLAFGVLKSNRPFDPHFCAPALDG